MGMLKKQRDCATKQADATSKALAPTAHGGIGVVMPGGEAESRGDKGPQRGALGPGIVKANRWRASWFQ